MKFKAKIAILASITALSFIAAASASISWFSNVMSVDINNDLSGESNGAYFASGTGEKDNPFIINQPHHLYNLAWLQYLGYFNNNLVGAEEGSTYFEIDSSLTEPLDMTGWIIPPIGTTLYPFVGNFDGNGKTITNLKVINSSTPADYVKYPSPVRNAGTVSNVNVLGAFGVFGTCGINNSAVYPVDKPATADIRPHSETNAIENVYFDNTTVKNYQSSTLAGIAFGYVNAPIENVGVSSSNDAKPSSIDLTTSASVYGGKTTNLSDYTIAGFCEDEYTETIERLTSNIYSPTTVNQNTAGFTQQSSGSSVGFGGSIDMKEMYDGLHVIWNRYNENNLEDGGTAHTTNSFTNDGIGVYAYPTKKYNIYDKNGDFESTKYGNDYNKYLVHSSSDLGKNYYYTDYQTNGSGQKTSQYTITHRSDTDRFLYLYGHSSVTVNNTNNNSDNKQTTINRISWNNVSATLFKISCVYNGTTYYLTRSAANTLGYTTSEASATEWIYKNNYIYYNDTSGNNSSFEYLRYNNSSMPALTTNQSERSSFSYDSSNRSYYTTSNNKNYYLTYEGSWVFKTNTTETYYLIHNNNDNNKHYLCASGTSATGDSDTQEGATRWQFNGKQAYIKNGGTNYYIRLADSNNGSVTLSTSARGEYSGTLPTKNGISTNNTYTWHEDGACSDNDYYLRYDGGWKTSTTPTQIYVTYYSEAGLTTYSSYTTTGSSYYEKAEDNTGNEWYTFETNHTYFPLRQNTVNGVPDGTPLNSPTDGSNTGYVVGGGDSTNWQGSIRISQYNGVNNGTCSLLGVSQSNNKVKIDTIYTIDNDNKESNPISNYSQYERLSKAKESLEDVLTTDKQWIYGLHFVNTAIQYGDGVSAFAESAYVNGESYTNYELPTNCIDFNLKEKGYINFIAGAYFSGNNCFFTLNEIQRNSTTQRIDNMRNIAAVYSDGVNNHSVILEYSDYDSTNKQYSVPYKLEGGNKVQLDGSAYTPYSSTSSAPSTYDGYSDNGYKRIFNCRWIDSSASLQKTGSGGSTRGYPYYFEILMNAGEYCLGSPSFNGANGAYLMYLDIGAKAQLTYRSTVTDYIHEILEQFVLPLGMAIISAGTTNVNNKNSYVITIKSAYTGTVKVDRGVEDDVDTGVYSSSTASDKIMLSYSHNDIVVNNNEQPTAVTKIDKVINRTTYYDFLPNLQAFNKSIIEKTVTTTYSYGVASSPTTTYTVEQYAGYTSISSQGTHVAKGSIALYDNGGYTITTTPVADNAELYKATISEANYNALMAPDYMTFNTSTYSSFVIIYDADETFTINYLLTTAITATDTYSLIDGTGYSIRVTLTDGAGTVTDITNYIEIIQTETGYTLTYSGMTITIALPPSP